jgi:hypothetical protein
VEGIWRQALDVFRGGLLADWCVASCALLSYYPHLTSTTSSSAERFPLEVQDAEEKFDLALIATLEIDVVPHLGDSRVSDGVIVSRILSKLAGI